MNLGAAFGSSIGRKILNSVTGLFFVGFVIGHLIGNLLLLAGPDAFNSYADLLTTAFHGVGLILVEIVMVLFLLTHAWTGLSVWRQKWGARDRGYAVKGHAGAHSPKSLSSQSMLWTGILLLVFIIFHIAQFKYGLIDERDASQHYLHINGLEVRNLYGLVVDSFYYPWWTIGYIVIMVILGVHLWHGAWSAFQSLGLANSRSLPVLRTGAHILAVGLALGFLALPAVIYLQNPYFQQLDKEYVNLHAPMTGVRAPMTGAPASPSGLGE